jgi:hypothetical protein
LQLSPVATAWFPILQLDILLKPSRYCAEFFSSPCSRRLLVQMVSKIRRLWFPIARKIAKARFKDRGKTDILTVTDAEDDTDVDFITEADAGSAPDTENLSEAGLGDVAEMNIPTGTDLRKEAEPDDGLCERCRALGLKDYFDQIIPEYKGDTIYGPEAAITRSSIQEDCSLCLQLAVYFDTTTEYDAFGLKCYDVFGLSCYDTWSAETSHYNPYIQLYFGGDYILHLFPTKSTTGRQAHPDYHDEILRHAAGRPLGSHADLALVKEWLKEDSSSEFETTKESPIYPLRLIDCTNEKLCIPPPDCPYIALSYTWGNAASKEPQNVLELPEELPKTVKDAIAVARALEIPHLWVDRYCIDQSNNAEVHQIVQRMDKVYSHAELTIIASAGSESTYGLPGVSTTPRRAQRHLSFGKHLFVQLAPSGLQVRSSRWNSRSWTYQEGLLSKRRLVFTESLVYFHNRSHRFVEDVVGHLDEMDDSLDDRYRVFNGTNIDYRLYIYHRLVEYYPKHLTFKSDALKAFEGVFAAYRGTHRFSHFWGIPILSWNDLPELSALDTFANSLTWKVEGNLGEFDMAVGDQTAKFPSWSWAALKAGLPDEGLGQLSFELQRNLIRNESVYKESTFTMSFTRRDGQLVDIAEYATRMDDYENYLPQIDVSSWSISAKALMHTNPSTDSNISELKNESIQFDGVRPNLSGKNTMVVLMNVSSGYNIISVRGLVIEEMVKGHWRRVGVWWNLDMTVNKAELDELYEQDPSEEEDAKPSFNIEKLLARYSSASDWDESERWQRRSFRLV